MDHDGGQLGVVTIQRAMEIAVERDVAAPVLRGETPDVIVSLPESLQAGFARGDAVGQVSLSLGGETLCSVPLTALEGVPRATFRTALRNGVRNWLLIAP